MSKRIDLNGAWQLRWHNGQRGDSPERLNRPEEPAVGAITGRVPGSVHLDLMAAGLLSEPTLGMNAPAARWVEEYLWYYRRRFEAPDLAPDERAWLVLPTVDLAARVWLNGQLLGAHANAFRPCRLEVTGALRPGSNLLVVEVESGLRHAAEKPAARGRDEVWHKRHWLRQVQSTFGWDWAERLLNVGLRGGAFLEICSAVRVDQAWAATTVAEDLKTGLVHAHLAVEGLGEGPVQARWRLALAGAACAKTVPVTIQPGENTLETTLSLAGPELWWPAGHGPQPLCELRMLLEVQGRTVLDEIKTVGFRKIRFDESEHPGGGRYFALEVNDRKVFCKGGNFVPADPILARIDRARYETLIDRARESHFNLLRVWGGGLYESDDFYDLCNRRGLLVWQDFIFACEKYPAYDKVFYDNVAAEAAWQVRRLAHHPSLAVWCGNNENEVMFDLPDRQEKNCLADYGLYHQLLPWVVRKEDGTRPYRPSSPYSGDGRPPNDPAVGDQHPWQVGFSDTDFRAYRRMSCRFADEGGFLGPTALPTVLACLPEGQRRPGSLAWELRDNAVNSWGVSRWADDLFEEHLGRPLDTLSIEDYVYWGGVLQGEALAEYTRNFRRRMFDNAAAVFWMFNDCWPMVRSWTTVDYYLRRTPSFHPVRRMMAPLIAAVVHDGETIRVFGVNEGPAVDLTLQWGLFALTGERPVRHECAVHLLPNAATPLAELPVSALTALGETRHGAYAVLLRDGQVIAQDRLFLPLFKEMDWPQAAVRVTTGEGRATFSSNAFAWRVCLDLDGEAPLPDNFFDIFSWQPVTLDWADHLPPPEVLRVGNGPAPGENRPLHR